ncbi:MAG: DNA polymerase III subunit chi [Gammaproteobacteria bacterium]|nr:DNA polymerase III subunit chi [Gammaproteobacteria bacterium]
MSQVEMSAARVSFYVLGSTAPNTRLGYACRLLEKAYKLQNRIHTHTDDPNMARALDTLLWTFRQGSFVPHELLSPDGQPTAPITIGSAVPANGTEPPDADLLINLAAEVPAFYTRYPRIAEIIDGSPAGREAGRARHRFYREQGLEPETHEVG